jgi:DNA-binding transcriptional MerR regulator
MEQHWTILELAELAADALAAAPPTGASAEARTGSSGRGGTPSGAAPVRANGRVRDVPNERLVRWYVTVGLVDPPLSRRGRVAQYGRRHLLQLVAVKRRQAEGRSLAEIQAELAGATDEALAAAARIPDIEPGRDVPPAAPARFWARSAALRGPAAAEEPGERDLTAAAGTERAVSAAAHGDLADRGPADGGPTDRGAADRGPADGGAADGGPADGGPADGGAADGGPVDRGAADRGAADGGRGRLVHGVRLAPGVTLLLEDAGREPDPDDTTAILNAARALLAELAGRRLREPGPEHPADVPGPPPEVGSRT